MTSRAQDDARHSLTSTTLTTDATSVGTAHEGTAGPAAWTTGDRREPRARRGVPATRDLETTVWPLLALAAAELGVAALGPPHALFVAALVAATATIAAAAATLRAMFELTPAMLRRRGRVRVAIVGGAATVLELRAELDAASVDCVQVVGAISPGPTDGREPELGALEDVQRVVRENRIDILLLGPGVDGSGVAATVMRACEGQPVRLCDLSGFYEDVFGRVPVSEVDDAWLRYVLHPRFQERRSQRLLDLFLAGVMAVVFLPLIGVLALLVRLDGGPAFFRQHRTGFDGRGIVLRKLRTMRWEGETVPAGWTAVNDARVTRLGGMLRSLHLDELPQLLNVLAGEMSLVGPRPEQPAIVARLEETLPLWRGRHRHRPGLTGWAQIHCGYGGSDDGSAWKLAHDLYYLRHRSPALDIAILTRTLFVVLASPRVTLHETPFLLRRDREPAVHEAAPDTRSVEHRFHRRPRALVTGGAGFIGSHLVDALLEDGYEVVALDDLSHGHVENLTGAIASGARLIQLDVTRAADVKRCLADVQPEVVIHLAAQIDVMRAVDAPMADAAINVAGTLAILEAARACGTPRFVLASTGGAIYGDAAMIPTPEHEPLAPLSPYGAAKEAAEQYAALYGRLYAMSTLSLRLANVYGPRQGLSGEGGVIARYCRARVAGATATVFGAGLQTRDYVYVGDVVDAFVAAGRSTATGALNVGTGTETTVLDLVQTLGLRFEFRPARAGEVLRSSLDARAAAEQLPWSARTSLADGLAATLAFNEGLDVDTAIAV